MYSEEMRSLTKSYWKLGDSYVEIASKFGISQSAVQNLISYELKKSTSKSDPKALIDKRKSLMLKRFIFDSNYKGVKVTRTSILVCTNVDVSQRTLANWLSKYEFKYKKGAQKL